MPADLRTLDRLVGTPANQPTSGRSGVGTRRKGRRRYSYLVVGLLRSSRLSTREDGLVDPSLKGWFIGPLHQRSAGARAYTCGTTVGRTRRNNRTRHQRTNAASAARASCASANVSSAGFGLEPAVPAYGGLRCLRTPATRRAGRGSRELRRGWGGPSRAAPSPRPSGSSVRWRGGTGRGRCLRCHERRFAGRSSVHPRRLRSSIVRSVLQPLEYKNDQRRRPWLR